MRASSRPAADERRPGRRGAGEPGTTRSAAATPSRSASASCCVSCDGPVRSRRDETAAELRVLGECGAPVAGRVEPAHQRAVDLLGERLERRLTSRQRDGAAQVAVPGGGRGDLFEQRDDDVRDARPAPRAPTPLRGRGGRGRRRARAPRSSRPSLRRRSASRTSTHVSGARPTRSRVATSASSPSERRRAQSALRRLARALSSRTSGQKTDATAGRGWGPGRSASHASSARGRPGGSGRLSPSDLRGDLADQIEAAASSKRNAPALDASLTVAVTER